MTQPSEQASASPPSIDALAALLAERTGQQLSSARTWRIDVALKPLVAECGLATIDQLVQRWRAGKDAAMGDRIVDALLNQETSFFRDPGIIDTFAEAVLARGTGSLRLWSAGCAFGQEPLSLAMAFAERGAAAEVIASDVSPGALARARAGRYSQFEIQRGLPVTRMLRWFEQAGSDWVAVPALRAQISYRRHNLATDPPPAGRFDAILCRNVLFYLTPLLRTQVLSRLADAMRPGGLLMLGAGETVIGLSNRFVPSARFRGFYELAPARACQSPLGSVTASG
ncbi:MULTISPECIES: protein-glutamate O-methyltransferase CheR [unclassified Sphingomonas]|uniref:CheR family methyltransferase n=1 Tax=unclassified Sphingomonas TaxID=196159 RepID=UPI000AE1FC95|nr:MULTISPECIES: protein-glutamate O-methyltransferase CheR [unclassified Sphingomonas]